MRRVEARLGRPLGDYLRERYVEEGMTTSEIGTELGINAVSVARWLRSFDIEVRFPGQRARGC
jgi:transposase